MPGGPRSSLRVAIVGASSLLGKELKQVLEDRNFPADEVVLLDSSVVAGTLTEAGGEPTFVRPLAEDSFEGVRFAFFAGSTADTEQNWQAAQNAGAAVIDLAGALARSEHAAAARIPSLAKVLPPQRTASGNGSLQRATYFSPPASVIIASTMAAGLGKVLPSRVALVLFPPVSERGQVGVEELESQTASLLSFREISKAIFDEQVAFNLITEYGAASAVSLADLGRTAARDVARFLAGRVPVPAMQFVQAPVFYGYTFAAYAELPAELPPGTVPDAFAGLGVKFATGDDPPPTNVSVAGESEIHLGRISPDTNVAGGLWIWGAADNLRLAATNAVRIAEELLAES
jgi:aspartate-semialdehyde dehydrogenase